MAVIRNVSAFVLGHGASVVEAMVKLNDNKRGFLVILDDAGRVVGTVTDGDIRRAIVENGAFPDRVAEVMRHRFSFAYDDDAFGPKFSDRIKFIPVVDRRDRRLVSIRIPGRSILEIEDRQIGADNPPFVIAEIGNNHNGSLSVAKELIDAAVEAGADCVKFQYRDMETLYRRTDSDDQANDLGVEYTLDLLSRFQLSQDDIFEAFDYTRAKGTIVMCTPWDSEAFRTLESYGLSAYKIASADLTNLPLLKTIAQSGKPMLLSTGMSHEWELKNTISVLESVDAEYALLHCNSTYPTPFKDVNLAYLDRLREFHEGVVGYSGHERGIEVPIAAVALGAKIIEKHFTFDRSWEGNDHKVSLLPDEFAQMVKSIHNVHEALGNGQKSLGQGELINRENLSKSIVAKHDLPEGRVITADDLEIRSPGQGLQPNRFQELVGRRAVKAKKAGDFFFESDLASTAAAAAETSFSRPVGIPVRYHDAKQLARQHPLDFVEFHLSYSDLTLDPARLLAGFTLHEFAVHAPELFENDHILDLSSENTAYRDQSIAHLRRVIEVSHQLRDILKPAGKTYVVVNAGGFSIDGFLPDDVVAEKYDRVAEAYKLLNESDVELIFQTMPPFPWHFGGQRYHNLFCNPGHIVDFNQRHGARVCLDVSHTSMSAQHFGFDFYDACEKIAPLSPHMHIVDAYGTDGEGIAIGEGDINFKRLGEILRKTAPEAQFIPEIWQGHKNDGEGFWHALEFLGSNGF
ncbi:MAG: N-acetylneuraminate synthase family protein [Paracoccaceae bacterium]|jgi:N-acetylneuraminate synthase|nr:N-acetylneuraminate synthase family protein [Paracoccaceae bacterium]MDP7184931.1 N-acetylneuraminate synthase family protein [Paracoccaceae bacterium]